MNKDDPMHTCCFTGHRKLPKEKMGGIIRRLDREIDDLIHQGVTNFISGGALGFDQMAALLVMAKRGQGHGVRLILALPCKHQDAKWNAEQKARYRHLLDAADEVVYVSEKYDAGCMQRRNRYMVERAAHCICALLHANSGTGQTVRYAHARGLRVVNVGT